MGIVSRFERTLQSAVGDTFARVFGGNVVASEIESALQQQAADGIKKHHGRKIVPNEYTVTLGPSDFAQFKEDQQLAIKAFTKHLSDYIAQQGWETDGPVVVRLVERETLHTGQFRADGEVAGSSHEARDSSARHGVQVHSASYPAAQPPGADGNWEYGFQDGRSAAGGGVAAWSQAPAAPGAQPPAAANSAPAGRGSGSAAEGVILRLEDGSGRTYRLNRGSNLLGRGQDAHFRLPDTGVSRQHVDIYYDGQRAVLSDLGSTNGTTVNGGPVQDWQLADGDVIRVGHSDIVVQFG